MSDSQDTAGFVAPEPADLAPLFPGYDIQSLIATGGMGAVYCAVQRSLERTVALKILPMEFSKDAAFCAGFEAEAKAMGRLNHPNLIGVYDFGEVNGMLYIMMEYVPGKSVYHSAYGMAIDQEEVIRLVTGICNGLAHAHEHGIIHRDIKPSNILLDLNAQPKIGDFGLARPIERKVEEGEEIFGTPHYTAPEVVNSPHSVDFRADIFSVGVLLHELLTGQLPANDPRPASTIIHCDPRFDNIVRRATHAVATARYASAKEIAHDLQVIASSLVPKVPRTGAMAAQRRVQPPRSFAPVRRKKASGAPMIGLLVLAVAGIAAFLFLSKPEPAKPVAPPPGVVIVPSPPKSGTPPVAPVTDPDETIPETPVPEIMPEVTEPVAEPDPAAPAETVPAAPVVVAPKFDVAGFFGRARAIMQERSKPLISSHGANLKANTTDFQRSAKRQIRKMKMDGESIDLDLERAGERWASSGGKIPSFLGGSLSSILGIDEIHAASLQKQVGIEDTLHEALGKLSATYILGLEKQIERLQPDNDPGAVTLIEAEIARTKSEPKYFPTLMRGEEEAAEESE